MNRKDSSEVIQTLREFFTTYRISHKPLIVGYSGGPDSKALLYALYHLREEYKLTLLVAHVDHGWREESTREAQLIQEEVESLGLPFFGKKLEKFLGPNLEEKCREARLTFFKELFTKYDCEAVLLAHQKEDVMETVFKRFLEGSHYAFQGISEVKKMDSFVLWRPFLSISKKRLEEFLATKHLSFLEDRTNQDFTYLRARLRHKIFPFLRENFGKNFDDNLSILSLRSNELKEYLDRQIAPWFMQEKQGVWGSYFDLSSFAGAEKVERDHFIRTLLHREKMEASRETVDKISICLKDKRRMGTSLKEGDVIIDREILFLFKKRNPFPRGSYRLVEGSYCIEGWKVEVAPAQEGGYVSSWRDLWRGQGCFFLPEGDFDLRLPVKGGRIGRKFLSQCWQENGVPVFLRSILPVVYQYDEVVGELLSGKTYFRNPKWKVILTVL